MDSTNSVQVDQSLASLAQVMMFSSANVQKNRRRYQKIGGMLGNLRNLQFILLEAVHREAGLGRETTKKQKISAKNREGIEKFKESIEKKGESIEKTKLSRFPQKNF